MYESLSPDLKKKLLKSESLPSTFIIFRYLFLGFGGFGAATSTGGGLFGANTAAKPAFSFGGTSTASSGFGGFGTANTGTSLFAGSTAAKPGGLFGSTGKANLK